ncbi:CRISPR-associated endoribonuclease Cas6 [Paraflavitalea speifideaquila]
MLKVTAPHDMIQLALNAGIGIHSSLGFGCLEMAG